MISTLIPAGIQVESRNGVVRFGNTEEEIWTTYAVFQRALAGMEEEGWDAERVAADGAGAWQVLVELVGEEGFLAYEDEAQPLRERFEG